MTDYADKAAIEVFYKVKGTVFMGGLPLYHELPPYIRGEIDVIATIIRSSIPDVARLVGACSRLLNNSYVMVGGGVSCNESDIGALRAALAELNGEIEVKESKDAK